MKRHALLGTVILAFAAGCGGGDGDGGAGSGVGGQPVTFELEEQSDSGKTGTVTLEAGIDTTEMTLEINPPRGTDEDTVHIHKGSCDAVDANTAVAHDVGFITAGLLQASIFDRIGNLTTGEFVIDVHDSKNPDQIIACGTIPSS